jgi:hypothetical protein
VPAGRSGPIPARTGPQHIVPRKTRLPQVVATAQKAAENTFTVPQMLVRIKTSHSRTGRPMIIPPPMSGVRSSFSRDTKADLGHPRGADELFGEVLRPQSTAGVVDQRRSATTFSRVENRG